MKKFHVQKQAYHSGSFMGNHVHRALKAGVEMHSTLNTKLYTIFSLKTFSSCATHWRRLLQRRPMKVLPWKHDFMPTDFIRHLLF